MTVASGKRRAHSTLNERKNMFWAALAPRLGAYADADSLKEAIQAPLLAVVLAVPCGCVLRGVLQGQIPGSLSALQALLLTAALVEAWRLLYFGIYQTDQALNKFVLALKGEEEEEDDF